MSQNVYTTSDGGDLVTGQPYVLEVTERGKSLVRLRVVVDPRVEDKVMPAIWDKQYASQVYHDPDAQCGFVVEVHTLAARNTEGVMNHIQAVIFGEYCRSGLFVVGDGEPINAAVGRLFGKKDDAAALIAVWLTEKQPDEQREPEGIDMTWDLTKALGTLLEPVIGDDSDGPPTIV